MNQNPSINEMQAAANGIKHLTVEQLEELMEAAMRESARDHAMLLVIFHHALRASEAADMKLADINWSSMEMTVARKKGSLKTTQQLVSQRGKPALDEVKALRRWLAERAKSNEPTSFVFASQKGGNLHPDVVNRLFKKYAEMVNAARHVRGAQPIAGVGFAVQVNGDGVLGVTAEKIQIANAAVRAEGGRAVHNLEGVGSGSKRVTADIVPGHRNGLGRGVEIVPDPIGAG